MWDAYTFFRTEEGVLYGVSPRIMSAGFTPAEGHRLATDAERQTFIQRALVSKTLPRPAAITSDLVNLLRVTTGHVD